MFLKSDYSNSITANQMPVLGMLGSQKAEASTFRCQPLSGSEGRIWPAPGERGAEWPSIRTVQRQPRRASSTQILCLIRGRANGEETVHKKRGLINISPPDAEEEEGVM